MSPSINLKRQAGCAFACPHRRSPGDEPCAPQSIPLAPILARSTKEAASAGRQVRERAWRMERACQPPHATHVVVPCLFSARAGSVPPRSSLPPSAWWTVHAALYSAAESARQPSFRLYAWRRCVVVCVYFHACLDFLPHAGALIGGLLLVQAQLRRGRGNSLRHAVDASVTRSLFVLTEFDENSRDYFFKFSKW